MATVVAELHAAFEHYHWTGFYRTVRPGHLQVGPYQDEHGCIDLSFARGSAARPPGSCQHNLKMGCAVLVEIESEGISKQQIRNPGHVDTYIQSVEQRITPANGERGEDWASE